MNIWDDALMYLFTNQLHNIRAMCQYSWWPLLCMQTLLSIKHASSVLDACDSSIEFTISCLVYIDIGTESVLYQNHDDSIFDTVIELSLLLLKVISIKPSVQKYDENENDYDNSEISEEQKEEKEQEIINGKKYLVNCIGVSGIPRNSMVEIEIFATTKILGNDTFIDTCNFSQYSFDELVHDDEILLTENQQNIFKWPLWNPKWISSLSKSHDRIENSELLTNTNLISKKEFSEPLSTSDLFMRYQSKYIPKIYLQGCIEISMMSMTTDIAYDRQMAWHISNKIRQELMLSTIDLNSIKEIRVYYLHSISLTSFQDNFHFYYKKLFGQEIHSILYYPVLSLGKNIQGKRLMLVSIRAINIFQLRTKLWISQSIQ